MPITAITFLIGALALAGIPPFAGFFSKDPIIEAAYHINWFVWALLWLGAGLTAFYIFRLYFLVFENGDRVHPNIKQHLHESPWNMTLPLIVLASGTLILGFFREFFLNFLKPSLDPRFMSDDFVPLKTRILMEEGIARAQHVEVVEDAWHFLYESLTSELGILALITAIGGIFVAYLIYQRKTISYQWLGEAFKPVYNLFYNRWYIDNVYYAIFVYGYYRFSVFLWKLGDKVIIDGIVDGSAKVSLSTGGMLRLLQSGRISNYVLQMSIGILIFLSIFLIVK
jgi:NADH-quinone oxidoreductase subunit L